MRWKTGRRSRNVEDRRGKRMSRKVGLGGGTGLLVLLVALFFGVVWTIGPVAMVDMKLNFLNFIGLPITFGIGIDYAVNVLNRYRIEGPGSMERAVATTGGAVALCSLTTLIGYSSLLIADNQALTMITGLENLYGGTNLAIDNKGPVKSHGVCFTVSFPRRRESL